MRWVRIPAAVFVFALWFTASAAPQEAPGAAEFARYEGTYQLPAGATVVVGRQGVVAAVARPYFLDWETGRFGYLTAAGPDRFTAPSSVADKPGSPARTTISFSRNRDGGVDGLTIQEAGAAPRLAARVALWADRDVMVTSGDIQLAATLRTPTRGGRTPAVVLIHGSGPGTRSQVSVMNAYFASRGLAVLSYDKRGCGGSSGDWRTVDLDGLARDAVAAARWLMTQTGIDASRVGVWGISQGGWVGPLAASLDPDIAFVINTSGPATSLRRQDLFMMTNTLRTRGATSDDIAVMTKALNLLYDFGQGRAAAAELDAAMGIVRIRPALKDFALPSAEELTPAALYARQSIGDPAWFFHLNPDHDALKPYRRLRCPVLVTYGGLDYTVPVDDSVRLLREVAAPPGRTAVTIETIPDAGHGYLRMQPASPATPESPTTVSTDLFQRIDRWLTSRGLSPR